MTEKDKRAAIIIGTVILAVLILLWFRRHGSNAGSDQTIVQNTPFNMPGLSGPSFGPIYYGDEPWNFTVPGLDLSGPNLSMIGACCSDCGQAQPVPFDTTPGNTFVFNEGDAGPNIYNYYAPAPAAAPAPQKTVMYGSFG